MSRGKNAFLIRVVVIVLTVMVVVVGAIMLIHYCAVASASA